MNITANEVGKAGVQVTRKSLLRRELVTQSTNDSFDP